MMSRKAILSVVLFAFMLVVAVVAVSALTVSGAAPETAAIELDTEVAFLAFCVMSPAIVCFF